MIFFLFSVSIHFIKELQLAIITVLNALELYTEYKILLHARNEFLGVLNSVRYLK